MKFFRKVQLEAIPGYYSFRLAASKLNTSAARWRLNLGRERHALIVLTFHAIVLQEDDLLRGILYPKYCFTLEQFERCVKYYLSHDYIPISLADLSRGLPADGRYIMFTFDDGYHNNLAVLPILETYRIPALFAIVTDHVFEGKAFWWDVMFRHGRENGKALAEIDAEIGFMTLTSPGSLEQMMVERGGPGAMTPIGDLDSPFKPEEIRELAKHPLISLANHTASHEFLPNCSSTEAAATIDRAQTALEGLTDRRPVAIAYPYGARTKRIEAICRSQGLKFGFTTQPLKLPLPVEPENDQYLEIPRFGIGSAADIEARCEETRFDWKPSWFFRRRIKARKRETISEGS